VGDAAAEASAAPRAPLHGGGTPNGIERKQHVRGIHAPVSITAGRPAWMGRTATGHPRHATHPRTPGTEPAKRPSHGKTPRYNRHNETQITLPASIACFLICIGY